MESECNECGFYDSAEEKCCCTFDSECGMPQSAVRE